ncbi:MAG: hypothetical protein JNK48_28315 [Bryobacterales bacterium]|nr:hypothetical protein [Bryobacterales bacterium]
MKASRDQLLAALEAILESPEFRDAGRLGPFLRHLATVTLDGETDRLKESVLGVEFFKRGADYDPRLDPVVRVEARRLRQRLEKYYVNRGGLDRVRLELPKGGYQICFVEAGMAGVERRRYGRMAAAVAVATMLGGVAVWKGMTRTEDDPARVALLRGRHQMNLYSREGLLRAVRYFEEALRMRPEYAPALAGLSQTYSVLAYYGDLPKGVRFDIPRTLAERAVAADGTLADAQAALGFALGFQHWRWAEAESAFRRAIAIDANAAAAHSLYAVAVLLPQTRFEEGIAQLRQGLNIDPNSSFGNFVYAFALLASGRTEEAIGQYRRTMELGSVHPDMEWDYGMALGMAGRHGEAADAFRRSRRLRGERDLNPHGLEALYSGDRETAARDAKEMEREVRDGRVECMDAARLFSMLGETDKAFYWMERAIEVRETQVVWLRADPRLRALQADARFRLLAGRIGL